jgi:hypothetical protein
MVIETFRQGAAPIYERFAEKGRQAPDGLTYLDSWIDAGLNRCFQLMECDDLTKLQAWVANWEDIADFEIVPVVPGSRVGDAVRASE